MKDPTFLSELWQMIRQEKQWWLIPLVVSLAIVGAITLLSVAPAAPFIYTLF